MTGTQYRNTEFELRGINHLALVARDMAETVQWYEEVLGMRLVKTQEMPSGGQHFFLDVGNGVDGIAFFWWPDAIEGTPNEAVPAGYDDQMNKVAPNKSAIGTMHHVAFDVPAEKIDEYLVKLRSKGIPVTEIVNHAKSLDGGHKADYDPATDGGDVFIRSLYFKDPNGTILEFACWTTTFDESDIAHRPKTAADLVTRRPVPA
jgi:catechol 2,3-dioxygenase-like lactoylglutathione lyase family enzyme